MRLTEVDGLERFLGRAFTGYKRFSIEGTDALVPMLDTAIDESAAAGARHITISMSHRGRINVLARVMGKPIDHILGEFQGRHDHLGDISTGDVKYHLGFESEVVTGGGSAVRLSLVPNPSHLEIVNPVLQGYTRAHQRVARYARGAERAGRRTDLHTRRRRVSGRGRGGRDVQPRAAARRIAWAARCT